jgi:hypothetical protein
MRIVLVLVLLATLAGRSARADDRKSPEGAAALSIGATVVGGVWMAKVAATDGPDPDSFWAPAAILTVGPSLGHFYTGSYGLGVLGIAARVGGALIASEGAGHCELDPNDSDGCIRVGRNSAVLYTGEALMVGAALAEIIDAPLSANRYNSAHATVQVFPMTGPDGRVGLAIGGTF